MKRTSRGPFHFRPFAPIFTKRQDGNRTPNLLPERPRSMQRFNPLNSLLERSVQLLTERTLSPSKLLVLPHLPATPQLRTPPGYLTVPFLPPPKLLAGAPPKLRFTPPPFLVSPKLLAPPKLALSPDYLVIPFHTYPKLLLPSQASSLFPWQIFLPLGLLYPGLNTLCVCILLSPWPLLLLLLLLLLLPLLFLLFLVLLLLLESS